MATTLGPVEVPCALGCGERLVVPLIVDAGTRVGSEHLVNIRGDMTVVQDHLVAKHPDGT